MKECTGHRRIRTGNGDMIMLKVKKHEPAVETAAEGMQVVRSYRSCYKGGDGNDYETSIVTFC